MGCGTSAASGTAQSGPKDGTISLVTAPPGEEDQQRGACTTEEVVEVEPVTHHEDDSAVATVGNPILRPIRSVRELMQELQERGEMGSPSDADLEIYRELKAALGEERAVAAKAIGCLTVADVPPSVLDDARDALGEMLQDVVEKGDHEEGVLPLFRALKSIPGFDFAEVVRDRDLHCIAAFDGSIHFLKEILETPNLKIDPAELAQACVYNQSSRIQLTSLLLDYEESLGLASIYEEVEEVWNEFFADIASKKKANDKENRKGRMELVKRILCHPVFKVNMEFEGGDSQTPFTRACRENDAELMTALLADAPNTIDVNRVQSDKLTALHQCVFGDSPEAAKLLLGMPQTDVGIVSPAVGDPLSFAKALGRSDMVALLEG